MSLTSVFEQLTNVHRLRFEGEDEQARARVLVWLFPAGLLLCVTSALVNGVFGHWAEVGTSSAGLALMVGTLVAWRRTGSFAVTANILCTCHTILWTWIGYETHDFSAIAWLSFGPLLAFFLAGSRVGRWWLVLSCTLAAGLLALTIAQPVQPATPLVPQVTRAAVFIPAIALLGLMTQLSRERAMRALTQAGHRAETANRAKSRFLASISHEIRTPLNGILGTCELALNEPLPPRTREHLEVIQSSGATLLALINDLLDLSKAEAGRLEMAPHAFRVEALVTEVVALHQARARSLGSTLTSSLELPAGLSLHADSVRVRQVLHNLIGNALKFGEGRPVEVKTMATARGERWLLALSVKDHGRGMREDEVAELFKPFSQLRPSDAVLGSGLGLAISSTLTAQMGGTLSVRSAPGQGSTFTLEVELPIADAPSPAPSTPLTGHGLATGRVLVVDDNLINLRVAAGLLERLGQTVVTASSGQEALDVLAREPFDLVLMDLQMPEPDGLEVTRRLRALERTRTLPIVALTASALASELAECLTAGMNETLTKPVQLASLRDVLGRFLPRRG